MTILTPEQIVGTIINECMSYAQWGIEWDDYIQNIIFDGEKRAAEIIAEQLALREPQWRPIADAPKQVEVDLCNNWGERIPKCYFDTSKDGWMTWEIDDFDTMSWVRLKDFPTHWMLPPKPPTEGTSK